MAKIMRGLGVAILGYLVITCLLLGANATVFVRVTADRDEVKSVLYDSGVYGSAAPAILDTLARDQLPSDASVISLKNPEVKRVATNVFGAEFMQRTTDSMLDGTYDWLEGKSSEPKFKIELKSATEKFALGLSDYAADRQKTLPPCNPVQLQQNSDILSAKCALPGVSKAVIQTKIKQALKEQPNLLSDQTIKASDIKDSEGKPLSEKLINLPGIYQKAMLLPWVFAVIALASAFGLYFISETRNQGFKRLGITLVGAGILLLFTPYAINFYLDGVLREVAANEPITNSIIFPLVKEFYARAASIYYIFGAVSLIVGAAFLVGRRFVPKS